MTDKNSPAPQKRKRMLTSSAKSKGRALQDEVRDALRILARDLGLTIIDDDVVGREMGQKGVDVRISPAVAKLLCNPLIECKNCERLNVVGAFREHQEKYADQIGLKFLVHTRNKDKDSGGKKQPRVVLVSLEDFMDLLRYKIQNELRPALPQGYKTSQELTFNPGGINDI